ncbi:hypothetical protein F183_A40740 [Bryobacterales bacterium F-183]|nr:hypothetical protein F183_A40740 [Bryobacterales bacterium F-183]
MWPVVSIKTVSKVLHALMLVAAILWSSVCFAECRILPREDASQKPLPPCHKQQKQEAKPACVDPGACVYEVTAGASDLVAAVADVPAVVVDVAFAVPPVWQQVAALPALDHCAGARPRTSVLRI